MHVQDLPIRRKLMIVILLTCAAVLLVTCSAFFVYEYVTFRSHAKRQLKTVGEIIAANTTSALAFDDPADAGEVLSSLTAERHIVAAALYKDGRLYSKYPAGLPDEAFPAKPGLDDYWFEHSHLVGFQPVVQRGKREGTLYLKSDMDAMYERFRLYGKIATLVILLSLLVAYGLSRTLQKQIAEPILALAETAKIISHRRDYSVRAHKLGSDELGLLTDAFNQMLTEIQDQNQSLGESEARVRAVLNSALSAVVVIDSAGKITEWNARAERMFGWTKAEAVGLVLADAIIPARYRDAHRRGLEHYLATGEGPVLNQSIELNALRRDGTEFPVELSISPMKAGGVTSFCGFITDITERKRQEEMRARLVAIVLSSEDAIISKTLAGIITSWNPGAEKLFGYTPEDVVGKSMLKLIPPGLVDEEADILARLARGETVTHFETTRKRKDGTVIDVSATMSPIRDSLGRIVGISTIARDISERNRAQRVLRKSEAQLRLVWENSLDGMRLVDEEGVIRMVNDAYCRMVGKPRVALEGQSMSVLFEAAQQKEALRRHRERFRQHDLPAHHETEITLWNGKRLFVERSNSFLEVEEQSPLLFSTFRDITERKQSEKREAAFAKLGQNLSSVATAAEAARLIADTADELFGWDACTLDEYLAEKDVVYPIINIDTIDGKRVDISPSYVGRPPTTTMRRVLQEGAQLLVRRHPNGPPSEMIPFGTGRPSASLMHVPIHRGQKVIGILSIQSYTPGAYDAKALHVLQTLADQCAGAMERVRAEEDLRRLNEELEQRVRDRTAQVEAANKELESFSYSVSHDLRAPLRHIDGFAEMLRKEAATGLSAPGQRFLGIISHSAKRMGALIDDLLVFSRMGRSALRPARVKTDELVAEVLREMASDLEGRTIEWDIGPLADVIADRSLLKQVWVNLLSNAVKYTRRRAQAVIKVRSREIEGGELEFSVQDNGAGFDMNFAAKLFGVFQRLHQTEEFEGTGIGLANVRRIISRHGGKTWAEGKVDSGATFYFTLPNPERTKP